MTGSYTGCRPFFYPLYLGLGLEQRCGAARAHMFEPCHPGRNSGARPLVVPDGAEGGAAFREVTQAGTARKPPSSLCLA